MSTQAKHSTPITDEQERADWRRDSVSGDIPGAAYSGDVSRDSYACMASVARRLERHNADLLAALQEMVTSYRPAQKSPGALWLIKARAAIRRATGE